MTDCYSVSALDYLERSLALRRQGDLKGFFHAAFELRCALERTPLDYAVLAGGGRQAVLKHPGKYKPRDVFTLAREIDPEIEMRISFTNLVLRSLGILSEKDAFDLGFLETAHKKCNQYLHALRDPVETVDDPEWVGQLKTFLDETGARLLAMWRSNRGILERGPKNDSLWALYKSGKYSDEQILSMLTLSE